MEGNRLLERLIGLLTWLTLTVLVVFTNLFPGDVSPTERYIFVAVILLFVLTHYYLSWRYSFHHEPPLLKDLHDILFLGIIMVLAKEYGVFFVFLFLPLATAGFALNLLDSVSIAAMTALLLIFEMSLLTLGIIDEGSLLLTDTQILVFMLLSIFSWFLALSLRHEKEDKEIARTRMARIEENTGSLDDAILRQKTELRSALSALSKPLARVHQASLGLTNDTARLPKTSRALAETIEQESEEALRAVEALTIDSRLGHTELMQLQPTPISRLLHELLEEYKPRFKAEKKKLVIKLPKTALRAHCDPEAARAVLVTLLEDGLRTIPGGATLTVTLKKAGQTVVMTLSHRSLHEMSVSADLPLSTAKNLAQAQHGNLSYEVDPAQGTRAIFTLPA